MKKILSLMTFVTILFVASITQAAPYIEVEITATEINQADKTIRLYTTLTNLGDQDARVVQLTIKYFKLYDADGNMLGSFNDAVIQRKACYVKAGYHVDDVEWVLHFGNGVPDYNGDTQTDWDASVQYFAVQ